MDPAYLIQATLYSKIVGELSKKLNSPYHVGLLSSAFMLYRLIPSDANTQLVDWYTARQQDNDSCIVISTHKKSFFAAGLSAKEIHRSIFSMRFKGVNHHLINTQKAQLSNLVETIRYEYDRYSDEEINYILLPHNQIKFRLCADRDIWIETIIKDDASQTDESKVLSIASTTKAKERTYIYKLTKPGKGHTQILEKFIDECVEQYKQSMLADKSQKIFELVKTQRDESDKINMVYSDTDFKSNKYLDKNLFYPEVKELTEYIDRFPRNEATTLENGIPINPRLHQKTVGPI